MAIWDFKRLFEEGDGCKPVIRQFWVPPHDRPIVVCERSILRRISVRDTHLAYVMQQCATAQVFELVFRKPHHARQFDCHIRHTPCVTFRLVVAQVQACDQPSIVAS